MRESPVYEVRCEHCRTSFAPETKRCIHCGRPLGRSRPVTSPARFPGTPGEEASEDLGESLGRARNPLWIVTALLVVAASMLRTCLEGGG